jgi:hypothetical protein
MPKPDELFYTALAAFAEGDLPLAAEQARAAAEADSTVRVFAEGAAYLERVLLAGKGGVYVTGEAFAAFIRGGGNLALYAALSAALRDVYAERESVRLLDVGVGDGMALIPALAPQLAGIQLVEPSEAMLARAIAGLDARGVRAEAFAGPIQAFASAAPPEARWEIAQATFSLQSLPPEERREALRWLRSRVDRLLIAEFDVPALCADALDPACLRHITVCYEAGLAEYDGDGGLVAQGFLMPVMFGYVDPTAARTNYEQPIQSWSEDLWAAGFTSVGVRELFPYWWATAYLLDAA